MSKKPKYPKKAEFTAKWWADWLKKTPKALRKDLTSNKDTNKIDDTIAEYEVAKDLLDKSRMEKALKEFRFALAKAIKICDNHQDYDATALLQQFLIIHKKESTLVKGLADLKKGPPVKQKVKAKVVIWKRDLVKEVEKVYKPKLVKLSGYKVALELNGDILDVLEKEEDYVTPAYMVEDAQKVCDVYAKIIAKRLKSFDKLFAIYEGDINKEFELDREMIDADFHKLEGLLEKIPALRWKKFVARRQQYKKYKVVSACKMTVGACSLVASGAGLTGSVAGLFLPGSQGLAVTSLVLSIVGGLKSISKNIQLVIDLAKKAEQVQKSLEKNLKSLNKLYLKEKKNMIRQEVGSTILNTMLSVPIMNTVPNCEKDYKLWDNKVAGLTVAGRGLGKDFIKLMKNLDQLDKTMKGLKGKDAKKVLGAVRKLRVKVTKAFDAAHDMNARVNKAEKGMRNIKPMLDALKAKNSNFAKIFDKVFPVVVDLAFSGVSAGVGFVSANSVIEGVNTGLSLVFELEEMLADQLAEVA